MQDIRSFLGRVLDAQPEHVFGQFRIGEDGVLFEIPCFRVPELPATTDSGARLRKAGFGRMVRPDYQYCVFAGGEQRLFAMHQLMAAVERALASFNRESIAATRRVVREVVDTICNSFGGLDVANPEDLRCEMEITFFVAPLLRAVPSRNDATIADRAAALREWRPFADDDAEFNEMVKKYVARQWCANRRITRDCDAAVANKADYYEAEVPAGFVDVVLDDERSCADTKDCSAHEPVETHQPYAADPYPLPYSHGYDSSPTCHFGPPVLYPAYPIPCFVAVFYGPPQCAPYPAFPYVEPAAYPIALAALAQQEGYEVDPLSPPPPPGALTGAIPVPAAAATAAAAGGGEQGAPSNEALAFIDAPSDDHEEPGAAIPLANPLAHTFTHRPALARAPQRGAEYEPTADKDSDRPTPRRPASSAN